MKLVGAALQIAAAHEIFSCAAIRREGIEQNDCRAPAEQRFSLLFFICGANFPKLFIIQSTSFILHSIKNDPAVPF